MSVELSGLVIRCLKNGCASHCGLGGGNNGIIFSSDAEKNLPSVNQTITQRQDGFTHIMKYFCLAVFQKDRENNDEQQLSSSSQSCWMMEIDPGSVVSAPGI